MGNMAQVKKNSKKFPLKIPPNQTKPNQTKKSPKFPLKKKFKKIQKIQSITLTHKIVIKEY